MKIFIGIDFSECSINAAQCIVAMMKNKKCEIWLAHCYSEFIDLKEFKEEYKLKKEEIEPKYFEKLRNIKNELSLLLSGDEKKNISFYTELLHGYAEDMLSKRINELNPDLAVMGSPLAKNSITELMGSIISDLLQKVTVPVLAIPPNKSIQLCSLNNIMFLTDYKSTDFSSLHRLLEMMTYESVSVHCIHFCNSHIDKYDEMRRANQQIYCDETYQNHRFYCKIILSDDMIKSINEVINKNNIQLIALTKVKRNLISKLLHPDISKKLLFNAQIPIIIFNE
ncbi:MAG: universal stress protein [Marinilabiliaceae bacterium]|nr:universal stress protein [Marinilabiliaceae bacterium]